MIREKRKGKSEDEAESSSIYGITGEDHSHHNLWFIAKIENEWSSSTFNLLPLEKGLVKDNAINKHDEETGCTD